MQTHFLFDVLDGYKPFEQMAQESQNSGAVIAARPVSRTASGFNRSNMVPAG